MRLRQVLGGEVERLRDTVRIGLKRKRSFSREFSRKCIFVFLLACSVYANQSGKFENVIKTLSGGAVAGHGEDRLETNKTFSREFSRKSVFAFLAKIA